VVYCVLYVAAKAQEGEEEEEEEEDGQSDLDQGMYMLELCALCYLRGQELTT
jgi:hypothetical protein